MFGLGTTELIVIGVIIFLIFGAKRIPDIGKGLGGALKEFKNIKKDCEILHLLVKICFILDKKLIISMISIKYKTTTIGSVVICKYN